MLYLTFEQVKTLENRVQALQDDLFAVQDELQAAQDAYDKVSIYLWNNTFNGWDFRNNAQSMREWKFVKKVEETKFVMDS